MAAEDVGSTLSALERKLKELERELQSVGREPLGPPPVAEVSSVVAPPTAPVPEPLPEPLVPPVAPVVAPPPVVTGELAGLQDQLAELGHFRTQLEDTTRELLAEYERLLSRIGAPTAIPAVPDPIGPPTTAPVESWSVEDAVAVAREPSATAPAPSPHVPAATRVDLAAAPPAPLSAELPPQPWQQPPPGAGLPPSAARLSTDLDGVVLDGALTVDAGPFADIVTLSGFEQALGAMTGVDDVYVRGFEGDRALIDVTLGQPIAFGAGLRAASPVPFTLLHAAPGRVSVAIGREA